MNSQIQEMIRVNKSKTIAICSRPTSNYMQQLEAELGSAWLTHPVKELDKSIKCDSCGRHWCCSECAIEDDAIPGFFGANSWQHHSCYLFEVPMKKLILLLLCLAGCGAPTKTTTTTTYQNVQRVFLHDWDTVSILVEQPDSKELEHIWLHGEFTFVQDVARGEPMWVEDEKWEDAASDWHIITIHIHNPEDVEGGGWDHGKQGHGQVQVVE